MPYTRFIGQNWFEHHPKINDVAKKLGHSTNLKVKGDLIEGSKIALKDFDDICALEDRVTVTIDPHGKILTIRRA